MRDSHVRAAVLDRLNRLHLGDSDTRVVEEMGLWSGTVRVDVAVINGELTGIEIKSDRDTLDRLPLQAKIYSQVFDRMELVVGARHFEKARAQIPEWWTITVATEEDGCLKLSDRHIGERNPARNPLLISQLLWKQEAIEVLEARGLAKGWRSKRVKVIHERLATELTIEELSAHVRSALKKRLSWLRKVMPSQFDMPVDSNLDPAL